MPHEPDPPAPRTAAFYDLDGTLLNGTVLDHYLYYARHDPHLPARARRLVEAAVKSPYYLWLDRLDRRRFNEVFYRSYAGLSEDRLAMLGEGLFERVLEAKLYRGVGELLAADRAAGHVQVLLTGALDFVAGPVARHLGIGTVVASRLEVDRNGLCTGVLRPPVMAGPEKAAWIREYARTHGVDLERSVAYADDAADLPMLSMVGRPVAVNPDARLLATARSHGWPVLHVDAPPRTVAGALARTAADVGRRVLGKAQDAADAPPAQPAGARLGRLAGRLLDLVTPPAPGAARPARAKETV